MTEHENLMKRCQRGATNLNDANNLLAECYGMLGKLGAEISRLKDVAHGFCDELHAAGIENNELKLASDALRYDIAVANSVVSAERKDAQRYRWLKEKGLHHSIDAATAAIAPGVGPFICVQLPSSGAPNIVRLGTSADAYVDLSMGKEG